MKMNKEPTVTYRVDAHIERIETDPDGEEHCFARSWTPIAYYDTEQEAQEAVESMATDAEDAEGRGT